MGGATERPTAAHVFENLSGALAEASSASEPMDAELDARPALDSRGIPWPLFVSVLVANGWFIKPRTFPFTPGGRSVGQRFIRAVLRIPILIAAWAIALTQLPTLWVGLAFLAWAAWLTPKIRFINKQFQNVPEDD